MMILGDFWFRDIADKWTDAEVGACVLIMALAILILCLICIVKLLHSLLRVSSGSFSIANLLWAGTEQ